MKHLMHAQFCYRLQIRERRLCDNRMEVGAECRGLDQDGTAQRLA